MQDIVDEAVVKTQTLNRDRLKTRDIATDVQRGYVIVRLQVCNVPITKLMLP